MHTSRHTLRQLLAVTLTLSLTLLTLAASFVFSPATAAPAIAKPEGLGFNMYRRPAPEFDLNLNSRVANVRRATETQTAALDALRSGASGSDLDVRWNDFGGSPDVVMNFASTSFAGTPEEAGRAFLQANANLFGISNVGDLRLFSHREALGGHLLRFQQTFGGIDVKDGGIGLVMTADNRVVMASGPHFRDVQVNTTPSLSPADAAARADADLAKFQVALPGHIMKLLQPGLDILARQAEPMMNLQPTLGIYPTANDYKLVYKVAKFSTNPFGLYMVTIDAHTGETIARKDFVDHVQQQNPLPLTADVYPKYPTITQELKDQSKISVGPDGTPLGQERVKLRKFDPSNVVTGLEGTLTGTHALVNNALISKAPFAQAARGTWHFRIDDPANLEARTNEQNQLAEPAEHQDEINAFFFTTYLLEYVDHLHKAGDRGVGQGSFPDQYPNETIPLPATVHIPNVFIALDAAAGRLPSATDPNLAAKVLGLDNAFALNLTSLIEAVAGTKSPVVVNPTSYGHGFLFNDLALEGTVPYHEGMHAITSPIAGLEGEPEGGALNEGQADMWAFTITDNPSLGDYVVNAKGIRDRYRELKRDPDSLAYIRSAHSTLKYSDIGTLFTGGSYQFEEHYDGEIYMSTMWEIRQMLNRIYPNNTTYKRPQPRDGVAAKKITVGTDIFERLFLGSMYVLGTTAPDTLVKSRDALLVADQLLYPTNATEPSAPGKHRALIERLFASRELGSQAREVSGGAATISTQTTSFTSSQPAPAAPTGISVAPASPRSLKVSWQPSSGAIAYEVLKRQVGFENRRRSNQDQFASEFGRDRSVYAGIREFIDGDNATTGFSHVAYVSGSETSYTDAGRVSEVFAPRGLSNLFDHEYIVRAVGGTSNTQLGVSPFSRTSRATQETDDLTRQVESAISNVSFNNSIFAFDQTLTNARGAFGADKTIYAPLSFYIVRISDRTVTVRNPDGTAPVPNFIYNQTLPLGATSSARRLEFNNPAAKIFSFDARVLGQVFSGSSSGVGGQDGDGTSEPPAPVTYSVFSEEKTGTLLGGDPTGTSGEPALTYGDPRFAGITYADIEITTKSDAIILDATLSSTTAVDLDFELRTTDGQVLAKSAGATATEVVQSRVEPNTKYILRVQGFANGPAEFRIVSRQFLPEGSPNENAGTITPGAEGGAGTGGSALPGTGIVEQLLRFTINPLTKTVTMRLLK